jgi:chromosome segregation ATPase
LSQVAVSESVPEQLQSARHEISRLHEVVAAARASEAAAQADAATARTALGTAHEQIAAVESALTAATGRAELAEQAVLQQQARGDALAVEAASAKEAVVHAEHSAALVCSLLCLEFGFVTDTHVGAGS